MNDKKLRKVKLVLNPKNTSKAQAYQTGYINGVMMALSHTDYEHRRGWEYEKDDKGNVVAHLLTCKANDEEWEDIKKSLTGRKAWDIIIEEE